jgi:TP901 family phage tail tape measure protein
MASRRIEVEILGSSKSLQAALGRSSVAMSGWASRMQSAGSRLQTVGRNLTRNLTLPIVGVGVVAGKMALDYDTAINHVQALTGASMKQTREWSDQLLALAPKVAQSPQQLAETLYFVASSGAKVNQVLPITAASARAAASGMGDAQTIAQLLTSAINAYGAKALSAAQATDILTEAVKVGKAEPADLADNMGKIIPVAQAMGVKFSEAAALMAELTNTGLDAAQAATGVRATLTSIIKPSAGATKELKSLGLSVDDLQRSVRQKGLLASLQDLRTRIGDNKTAMGKLFPNVRALTAFLALTGKNAGNAAHAVEQVGHSTGAASKALAAAEKGPGFRLQQDLDNLRVAAIKLGNALIPAFTQVANAVATLATRFSRLSPTWQKIIMIGAGFLAVVGPMVTVVGALTTVVGFLASGFIALAAGELLAAAPITLIVIGLAALAAGLIYAYKHSETFRKIVNAAFSGVRAVVGAVTGFISAHWRQVMNAAAAAINYIRKNWRGLMLLLFGPFGAAAVIIIGHWHQIMNAAGAAISFIRGHWQALVSAIPVLGPLIAAVTSHWSTFRSVAAPALGAVRSILGGIVSALGQIVSWANSAANALANIHVPSISLPNLPGIPGIATGVTNFSGGVALVGERGPELVNLPRGADVHTAAETRSILGGGGRVRFVIEDWATGMGYFESMANGATKSAARRRGQLQRMGA